MSTWQCGHSRLREFTYVELATRAELQSMISAGDIWSGPAEREIRDRGLRCPACRNQLKRMRNQWAALAVAFVVGVLILGRC